MRQALHAKNARYGGAGSGASGQQPVGAGSMPYASSAADGATGGPQSHAPGYSECSVTASDAGFPGTIACITAVVKQTEAGKAAPWDAMSAMIHFQFGMVQAIRGSGGGGTD